MTDHNDKAPVGRRRTSALDSKRDYGDAPTDPLFMPEEHAVAVMRNEDNPIMSAVRMLQAMENGEVGNVAEGHWYALANGLERYQAGVADGFKQLQARLDMAERAHAKFVDEVAAVVGAGAGHTGDYAEHVLKELRKFADDKPGTDYVAARVIFDLLDELSLQHNSEALKNAKPRFVKDAIRALVDDIAKRKSPTALRHDLHNTTLQIEYLTASLRHIGRGVGACEWALAADDRAAVNDIVKGFDKLVGEKQEAEAKQTVAEQEAKSLLNDLRALAKQHMGDQYRDTEGPENPLKEIAALLNEAIAGKERGRAELLSLVETYGSASVDIDLVDDPFFALRDILESLYKNQKPEGMDTNVQTVITANARLYATLQAIEAVIQTSKV